MIKLTKQELEKLMGILLSDKADYAEIFVEASSGNSYSNFDNKRFTPGLGEWVGTSMRLFYGEEVIFNSIDSIKFDDLLNMANKMVKEKTPIDFKFNKEDSTLGQNDLSLESIEWYRDYLEKLVTRIKNVEGISIASAHTSTNTVQRFIATSDGVLIKKERTLSNIGYSATAKRGTETEEMYGQLSKQLTHPELLKEFDKKENNDDIEYIAEVAIKLLDAPRIESGNMPVILPSGFGAVLFHEACGHPLEAVAVATNKSKFAGKIGKQIASKLVTLVDDGTLENERGSSKYDDEGILNEKRVLIKDGILQGYLVDRYYGNIMGSKANGAGRRESFRYNNVSRMSNTFIQNGTSTVDEILKNTKKGFYAKRLGGGQVDPLSGQFNFGVSEGYYVEDGKIKYLVKGAMITGNGIDALLKVDMVADDFKLGPGTCGASSGSVPVTVGQPTLRVSEMTVGGK